MQSLNTKIIIGVSVAALLFLTISVVQEMSRRFQVQREVQSLEQDVQNMERSVLELSNLNQYFATSAYRERLAREKLNYKAPGERVVLLPEPQKNTTRDAALTSDPAGEQTILEEWWRLFFVEESPTS